MQGCSTRTRLSLIALLLLGAHTVFGQFTLSAEVRPRAELRNGYKTVRTDAETPAFFVEQRSRLNVHYAHEKLQLQLSFQDVRIWGSTSHIYKTDANLSNVFEAYGEYHFTPRLALRIGRQMLDYDNGRFIGSLDWVQQGRSHDMVKLMYADTTGFTLHAGAAFNQPVLDEPTRLTGTFYGGLDNYKAMQYLWLHKDWHSAKLSGLFVSDIRQRADSSTFYRQTYGLIGEKKLGTITVGGELYHQVGTDAAHRPLRSYLAAANITLATKHTPLTLGVDYLSGSDPHNTRNHTFSPLYGNNHIFYGYMDYFFVGNNHGQQGRNAGLVDVHLKTNFKLSPKTTLATHLHHFESAATVYEPTNSDQKMASRLGEEMDLLLNCNVSPDFNLKVGYSQLMATASLDALKGRDGKSQNQWAWMMLTFKPVLFQK